MVTSAARGRGVGRALGEWVLARAREEGYAAMQFNAVVETNVVAVRRGNAEAPWAKDIVAAYKSDMFKTAIRNDKFYAGFTLPEYFN
jgi:ABC-type metal ion transport system substrate-binding protein